MLPNSPTTIQILNAHAPRQLQRGELRAHHIAPFSRQDAAVAEQHPARSASFSASVISQVPAPMSLKCFTGTSASKSGPSCELKRWLSNLCSASLVKGVRALRSGICHPLPLYIAAKGEYNREHQKNKCSACSFAEGGGFAAWTA